jgi:hypothetical protein
MFKKAVLAFVLTLPFTGMTAVANSSSNPDSNSAPSGDVPMPNCFPCSDPTTPPTGK